MSGESRIYWPQESKTLAFRYIFHPVAQKDYESALEWYLDRSLDATENFIKAVKAGLSDILKDPTRYRNRFRDYREINLRKYPFTIVYVIEEELQLLVVVSVHHHKKRGGKYRRPLM